MGEVREEKDRSQAQTKLLYAKRAKAERARVQRGFTEKLL
jgi:hypothetical protein